MGSGSQKPKTKRKKKGNGLLRGLALYGGGVNREVVGAWGLTQEFDNQPARSGTKYKYATGGRGGGFLAIAAGNLTRRGAATAPRLSD